MILSVNSTTECRITWEMCWPLGMLPGEAHPCRWCHLLAGILDRGNGAKELNSREAFTPLLLTEDAMWPAASSSCHPDCSQMMDWILDLWARMNPFSFKLSLSEHLIAATGKETKSIMKKDEQGWGYDQNICTKSRCTINTCIWKTKRERGIIVGLAKKGNWGAHTWTAGLQNGTTAAAQYRSPSAG